MRIQTLVQDIYATIERKNGWFGETVQQDLAETIARRLAGGFGQETKRSGLRLSKMGPSCLRQVWYAARHPELAEPLPPWAEIKLSYGHMIEALAIVLARASGHHVTGEQDVVSVGGIEGHRDCVIDGCVVDVKSATTRSFQKFKTKEIAHSDSFGYLEQLDGYVVGSLLDDTVQVKDKGYLLVVDKQLGHMVLYEHVIRESHIRERIEHYKRIVARTTPPACTCETRSSGKSGNVELGVKASYSPYKWQCFPRLRCFLYSDGPKYLTQVIRTPDVPEITKEGLWVSSVPILQHRSSKA
jgi:hypothetical protein